MQKKHESRVNVVIRALCSKYELRLKTMRKNVVKESCGVKDDVVIRIEKCFGHVERTDVSRLTAKFHIVNMDENVRKGKSRCKYLDPTGNFPKKVRIKY